MAAPSRVALLPHHETLLWQCGPCIGSGRFGQVFAALRIPSGELLAVKQLRVQQDGEEEPTAGSSMLAMQHAVPLEKIQREMRIAQHLRHPHIVQCLGWERDGPICNIFMEYAAAGALSRVLKDLGPLPEPTIQTFVRQVVLAVEYLHSLGIAHRDLKCANLLLADDGSIKIADFGTATSSSEDAADADSTASARSVRDGLGSPYWMAPEIIRAEKGPDGWQKADIWGIGCVMFEMATGHPPWENLSNPLTAMFHIASPKSEPALPSTLSDVARDFLHLCFEKDPNTRPPAVELLRHPFLCSSGDTPQRTGAQGVDDPSHVNSLEGDMGSSRASDAAPVTGSRSSSPRSSRASSAASSSSVRDDYSSDEDRALTAAPAGVATGFELGHVRAIADYDSVDANELSLRKSEMLLVVDVNDFGWWRGKHLEGECEQALGWFPSTFVEWVPSQRMFPVLSPYTPENDDGEHMEVAQGDRVSIQRCSWDDDLLWAFGMLSSGLQGWFPFKCVFSHESGGTKEQGQVDEGAACSEHCSRSSSATSI